MLDRFERTGEAAMVAKATTRKLLPKKKTKKRKKNQLDFIKSTPTTQSPQGTKKKTEDRRRIGERERERKGSVTAFCLPSPASIVSVCTYHSGRLKFAGFTRKTCKLEPTG